MFRFIVRRLIVSIFILIGSSILAFILSINSGDPLQATYEMQDPTAKAAKVASITDALNLDKSEPERYVLWLKEVGTCVASPFTGNECTLGYTVKGVAVAPLITNAIATTFRLVIASTLLAIVVGVIIGIVTATRQYSAFDYGMTFIAFLCFSLPIFFVATMLKEYLAIGVNQWLQDPVATYGSMAAVGLIAAVIVAGVVGGAWRKRFIVAGVTFVMAFALVYYLLVSGWFTSPEVGILGILVTAAVAVLVWTLLLGSLKPKEVRTLGSLEEEIAHAEEHGGGIADLAPVAPGKAKFGGRPVLMATAVTAVAGVLSYLVIRYVPGIWVWFHSPSLFDGVAPGWAGGNAFLESGFVTWILTSPWVGIIILLVVAVAVAVVIGRLLGGYHRSAAVRASVLTALTIGAAIYIDGLLTGYPEIFRASRGFPIPTQGVVTTGVSDNFWVGNLDTLLHLLLPTISIMLISFATYIRYTRASMLDVLGQDYVRTARAKGLPERTVIVRHAFRNALIPITTIAALDFGAVLSGAIVTEKIFSWNGMGQLFITSLSNVDPMPIMAYIMVTATMVVVFNVIADIAYAFLDPRIRLS